MKSYNRDKDFYILYQIISMNGQCLKITCRWILICRKQYFNENVIDDYDENSTVGYILEADVNYSG